MSQMMSTKSKVMNETQIRTLIEKRVQAVRTKDVNLAMSAIAPDVLSFDIVSLLQYVGSDASRKRTYEWFASFQGPIGYELSELSIAAGDDVAFSHSLNHVSATKIDGLPLDMWWRATVCYCKINDTWLVTHEHNSVPFDVQSGQASLDLKP
jgi:ketosteroid isomerase-like protein